MKERRKKKWQQENGYWQENREADPAGYVSGSFSPLHSWWQSFGFDLVCSSLHHKTYLRKDSPLTSSGVNPPPFFFLYYPTSLTIIGFKNDG